MGIHRANGRNNRDARRRKIVEDPLPLHILFIICFLGGRRKTFQGIENPILNVKNSLISFVLFGVKGKYSVV